MFIGPCIILIVEYRQTNLMSLALRVFNYLMLNMFRMLIHPSSGTFDLFVELFHGLYCSGSMCVGVTVWFRWGGVVSGCRLQPPRNLRVSPYNGAAEGVCRFSIDGQPIADRTNRTVWAQCSLACYIMVAFSCRCILLVPFAAGCHVVVLFRRESVVAAIILYKLTSNCLPCSM